MSKEKYQVEIITSSTQTDFPSAKLEFAKFRLQSSNFKDWSGTHEIEVSGQLDYKLKVWAITNTKWTMKITNVVTGNIVFQESGHTGDKIPNCSVRSGSTNAR